MLVLARGLGRQQWLVDAAIGERRERAALRSPGTHRGHEADPRLLREVLALEVLRQSQLPYDPLHERLVASHQLVLRSAIAMLRGLDQPARSPACDGDTHDRSLRKPRMRMISVGLSLLSRERGYPAPLSDTPEMDENQPSRLTALFRGAARSPTWRPPWSRTCLHVTTGISVARVAHPICAESADAAGRGWRRSLIAELLPPVVRAAFGGEIEEIPQRLERADVPRFLIAVSWGVEEL